MYVVVPCLIPPIFTDRVSEKANAIGRVCPSVCFHSIFWTNWPLILIFCVCMGHDHSSPGLNVKAIDQGHCKKCVCYTSIYCGVLWVLIDGRNSRFLLSRHQLRTSAARRAAWRGLGQHQRRVQRVWVSYLGNAVGLTSIVDQGQFSLLPVYICISLIYSQSVLSSANS